jgi:hypothetical protein
MFYQEFANLARQVAGMDRHVDLGRVGMYAKPGLDHNYGTTLFAIPEIGMTGGPTRSRWGWDVILWIDGTPAHDATLDELIPDVKREYFGRWTNEIIKELGIDVALTDNSTQLLEALP